jgi:hypothetical protein
MGHPAEFLLALPPDDLSDQETPYNCAHKCNSSEHIGWPSFVASMCGVDLQQNECGTEQRYEG